MGSSKNNSRAIIIMRLEMREKHDMKSANKPDGWGSLPGLSDSMNAPVKVTQRGNTKRS